MFLAPSQVKIHPSYTAPELVLKYNQVSGAFRLLHGGRPEVRLGEGDLAVYIKALDVRTKAAVGQQAYELLPSVDVIASYISTPTYLIRNRFEFNHHDTAAAGTWGVSLDSALALGSRQAINQQLRSQLIWGVQSSNGEGIANMPGAYAVSLPPDSNGNDTLVTYDNGQLAIAFLGYILGNQIRMYQLGQDPLHTVICGPQRILGTMAKQNVVQLTSYQRAGAGVATTGGMIKEVTEMSDDTIEWCFDDTLIGQGAGGTDLVIITQPTVKNPERKEAPIDTNEFSRLMPGLDATTIMFMDMAAPREIRAPLPFGAVDVGLELRATSGWGIRPEGTTLLSIQYQ